MVEEVATVKPAQLSERTAQAAEIPVASSKLGDKVGHPVRNLPVPVGAGESRRG